MCFCGAAFWRGLIASVVIPCAILISPTSGQELDLRGLFRPEERAPDLATGYEVVANWPIDAAHRHHDAAVSAVAIDGDGLVWVLGRGRSAVQAFDAAGRLVRSWSDVTFRKAHGLTFDRDGNLWITDAGAHVAQKFTPDGKLLLTLGTPNESGEDAAHFDQPTDVAIGPDGGIYVSDGYGNNRVVRFSRDGKFLGTFGKEGSALGEFRLPHALAFDSAGRLYVADRSNARIQVFDKNGTPLSEFRNVLVPWDLWITPSDEVFVCGSSPMRWPKGPRVGVPLGIPPKDQVVMKLDTTGALRELWTFPMGLKEPGSLDWVHGIAVDGAGTLYLCDIEGKRAQKFQRLEAYAAESAARPATARVKK